MQLSLINPYLIYNFKNEHELIRAIEEISLKFTQKREDINDYLNDPRLVSAYAAFYLTTNVGKLKSVLNWLPVEFISKLNSTPLFDIGAGPGTYSIALRELVKNPILPV
jgi:ribosomal protein RSM22 (predicted rRNA methylase)